MFRVEEEEEEDSGGSTATSVDSGFGGRVPRHRGITECEDEGSEEARASLRVKMARQSRPSCVMHEMRLCEVAALVPDTESVLGTIHLDLALYHESSRFQAGVQDKLSAHFHLKCAADCENRSALAAISSLYTGLPNDILPGLTPAEVVELVAGDIQEVGLDYMTAAARTGDTAAKLYLARAYDSGCNLGSRTRDAGVALR